MNPTLSPEAEKAKNSIATARAQQVAQPRTLQAPGQSRRPLTGTVQASDLVNPPAPVTVPTPVLTPVPTRTLNISRNVSRDADGFIAAQTAEAQKLKDAQAKYAEQGNQASLSEMYTNTLDQNGAGAASLKELKDIQLQLNDMDTASGVQEVRIEGAAGQTQAQAMREVTQEQRENAVRTSGLAARAAVLQGNIETARSLAKDAVDIAFQDRQDKATNLMNQITMLQGKVDDQTSQLLEEEKRGYEAELASIEELKKNVSAAMVSGASQSEIAQLNDKNMDDASKLALAQSITARGANQERNLSMAAQSAAIRSSNASAALNEAELTAYTKAQEDAASGILTGDQVEKAQAINKDFEDEPIVKAYNEGLQSIIVLEDTLANGVEGIQDVQLVYNFMKAIDPTSVVKQDEFDKVSSSGNIFAGAYAKFNKGYLGTGGFLPPEVKDSLINTARAGFDARNKQYYNVKAEKARQINQRLGIDNGADYLTSYESAAPLQKTDIVLADQLSQATPEEIQDIMQRAMLIPNPYGTFGTR